MLQIILKQQNESMPTYRNSLKFVTPLPKGTSTYIMYVMQDEL